MDCELCGAKNAHRVAIVEGVKMVVCDRCVKTGNELHEKPIETAKGIVTKRRPEVEDAIVVGYAERIRRARQKAGMEQKELASKLNEKQSIISKVESGSMQPTIALARKIEKLLGIELVEKSEPVEFKGEKESGGLTLGDVLKIK